MLLGMTNPTASDVSSFWPRHDHDAAGDVASLSKTLHDTVNIAAGLATGGRRVDVAGLDRSVGLLCAKALDLPPTEGRAACARDDPLTAKGRLMSASLQTILMAGAALGAVLGIIVLAGRGARVLRLGQPAAGRRLVLGESLALDRTRRLQLVSCDGRECLLLIGGGSEQVVGWLPPTVTASGASR